MSGVGGGYQLLGPKSVLKQVFRYRSQRWSLGKAPGVARSFQERLEELKSASESVVTQPLNIGFAPPKRVRGKQTIVERLALLKQTKTTSDFRPPRHIELVDLDKVREEWDGGLAAQTSALHYDIYKHLFGVGAYFVPMVRLNVLYPGDYPVFWGNLLTPAQASEKPDVKFESSDKSLWTLALTTPDGHLNNPDSEYILWLVGNIKGGDVSKGEEIVSYMQPFPLLGIGTCRYVFVLYKQDKAIDFSALRQPSRKDPESRDFCTQEFYGRLQEEMTPAGLAFFQAEWDSSVQQLFHKTFSREQPTCCYDFPPPFRPKQTWFPIRKAFNLYLDRYRDEKQIAKEYLLRKLKNYDPWTGFPRPLAFPNAVPFKPNTPSWLKNEIKKSRLSRARVQDY